MFGYRVLASSECTGWTCSKVGVDFEGGVENVISSCFALGWY